jgi:multidrug resistance efflux pump
MEDDPVSAIVATGLAFAGLLASSFLAQDAAAPAAPAPVERPGTFVPAGAVEVKLELEAYQGPLELVEAVAHGTPVREGEVLARIELDAIDEQLEAAERDLRSTEIRHQNAREQARLDEESAAQRIQDASEALALAERALEVFEKTELELKRRGNDLSESYNQDNIEDQKDELAQLEKMYTADELTDATEEVVLKRSRRQLARSQASFELQQARRKFDAEYAEQEQRRQKQNAVRDARRSRERLAKQIEMERRTREDSLARLEPEMKTAREKVDELRRDRERLVLRAPRAGIALHGALDDYKPGRTAPRHEAGGSVAAKAKLFTIAPPGRFSVALDVPESLVLKLTHGMAVKVVPAADPDSALAGRLRFDRFPSPRSAGGPENAYDGIIEIDQAPPALAAGMRCKVVIEVEKKAAP